MLNITILFIAKSLVFYRSYSTNEKGSTLWVILCYSLSRDSKLSACSYYLDGNIF